MLPSTDPDVLDRPARRSREKPTRSAVVDRRRRRDGVRHPGERRTTSLPITPTCGAADLRRPSSWTSCSDATPRSAACPPSPSARGHRSPPSSGTPSSSAPQGQLSRLYYGAKHATPKIEGAIAEAAAEGAEGLVGLVLAPHYSVLSVGEYLSRAAAAADAHGLPARFLERYGADRLLVELLAERVRDAQSQLGVDGDEATVLFTAHSLPRRVLELGDRYPDELEETARLVAQHVGLAHFRTAWQSAGRTPEPWLGPDVSEHFAPLAASGARAVIVCPAGFTSDHLEVLYDLDIIARRAGPGEREARIRPHQASLDAEPASRGVALQRRRTLGARSERTPRRRSGERSPSERCRLVAVIGAGIAGLVRRPCVGAGQPCDVTVFEAAAAPSEETRLGSATFRGRPIDLGPDAFITRNDAAERLCNVTSTLGDELIAPSAAASAAIFSRGRLRPFPKGLALGIPTDFRALATSGIVSRRGVARAALDLVLPGSTPPELRRRRCDEWCETDPTRRPRRPGAGWGARCCKRSSTRSSAASTRATSSSSPSSPVRRNWRAASRVSAASPAPSAPAPTAPSAGRRHVHVLLRSCKAASARSLAPSSTTSHNVAARSC